VNGGSSARCRGVEVESLFIYGGDGDGDGEGGGWKLGRKAKGKQQRLNILIVK
jgi:hypothetical protein